MGEISTCHTKNMYQESRSLQRSKNKAKKAVSKYIAGLVRDGRYERAQELVGLSGKMFGECFYRMDPIVPAPKLDKKEDK